MMTLTLSVVGWCVQTCQVLGTWSATMALVYQKKSHDASLDSKGSKESKGATADTGMKDSTALSPASGLHSDTVL